MIQKLKTVIRSSRPPFLILTPVCVFLGASTAIASEANIEPHLLVLVLLGALLAHISVNTLNEYFDYRSGLDLATQRTPFSGGSGALPANPEMLNTVFATGIASLAASAAIGIYFAWLHGPGIIPPGILGIILIVTYTKWINRSPLLCLLAPGLGFGLLMVAGTQFVLTGHYSHLSWLAGLLPFFLVNNLLLLNQYPDIEADRASGRRHFPITHGVRHSNILYALFLLAAAATIVTGVLWNYLPVLSLIALIPLPFSLFSLRGAVNYGALIGQHPHYLTTNVAVTLLAPLLLGVALVTA